VRARTVIIWIVSATLVTGCSSAQPTVTLPQVTTAENVGTPTRPPPPPTSRAAAPAGADAVTLAFTGDMLVSDEMRARAARNAGGSGFDFEPMLREVAPILRAADWAVCHQETPISADNRALSGWPSFNAPYQLAEAEKAAGYDACSTASNHTVDRGSAGVKATLDTFDRVGLRHVGSARSAAESRRLTFYEVKGVRIGHTSYTFGTNGIAPPTAWTVNLIDPARVRADAARLRRAGADFVVVSLHFGEEKVPTPSAYQRQVVEQVMASKDVDLVIGHHAHVVQPVQLRPDGRWVVFGLGNLLAQQVIAPGESATPPHRDGVILRLTVARGQSGRYAVRRVGYVPTFVEAPSDVVRLAPAFSRRRTVAVLTSLGAPLVDDTPG
jgi:poly-gamma-glutamate capsule biosynthesis protein CapA/YwtB (metallophosphatase superfamily)